MHAQPSSTRQYNEYKRLSEATTRAFSVPERSYSAPAYSGSSSTYSGSSSSSSSSSRSYGYGNSTPAYNPPSAAEREKWRKESAALDRQAAEWRQIQANNAAAAEQRRRNRVRDAEQAYISGLRERYHGKLPAVDQTEMHKDAFFYYWIETPRTGYGDAEASIELFEQEEQTADYTELLSLAIAGQSHPTAAARCYAALHQRFPEKRAEIERNELVALTYFFGSRIGNLYPEVSLAYCEAEIEDCDAARRKTLLQRFKTLALQHPEDALSAAGYCRPHLNPFVLIGNELSTSTSEQADWYMKALHAKYSSSSLPKYEPKDRTSWEGLANRRLRVPAQWLIAHTPDKVYALSTEDWRAIATSQAISTDLIAWAFRDENADPTDEDKPRYWKRIPNLGKVRKK